MSNVLFSHAELVSASLNFQKTLKLVQGDKNGVTKKSAPYDALCGEQMR